MTEHAIIPGTTVNLRTLADNTVRIQIDIEPRDAKAAMNLLFERGTPVAIAVLDSDAVTAREQKAASEEHFAHTTRPHADYARALHAGVFFASPDVWAAIGPDERFLAWLRIQPCAMSKRRVPKETKSGAPFVVPRKCEGDVVPAHLRSVSQGAGTGIKPKYCAIPLCHAHHEHQHQHGYSSIHPHGLDGLMRWRFLYVQEWAHQALTELMGAEHLSDVDPAKIMAWAESHGVERYLPEW